MRDERAFLSDMIDSARQVQRYVAGRTYQDFQLDEVLQDAVSHRLEIIGEAASQVPATTRQLIPALPWKSIINMRSILIHAYFQRSLPVVWDTANNNMAAVVWELESYLKSTHQPPPQP
jgi:uncharacterized protein with HEPN domain